MLQALKDNIIVKPFYKKRISNLFIPETAVKFKQYDGFVYGEVMSIGRKFEIRFAGTQLKVGDKVLWRRHEGVPIHHEGERYLKLKGKWIDGKIIEDAKKE